MIFIVLKGSNYNFMRRSKYILVLFTICIYIVITSCEKKTGKLNTEDKTESFDSVYKTSKIVLPEETQENYLKRMQWWRDSKYGMFIHWGLYSILAGEYNGEITPTIAEWIQNTLKIPLADYKKLMTDFNPIQFNANEWVSIAKAAGMKYIVLTSKHHDGFALFESKVSDYNIMNTPYQKDIVKQLKEACSKQGLKFGLYYSHIIDWEHPDAFTGVGELSNRMNSLDYDPNKMDRTKYLNEKSFPQLKEILTNYGKIDILWFDMGGGLTNDEIHQFVKITRALQPEIIISSRIGEFEAPKILDSKMLFDFYTPSDNYFTGDDLPIPWEMCGTTNGSWGYRKDDTEWRGPELILNSLVACVSRNGNYLLNVGPMSNGKIPENPAENLKKVGYWLDKNGEAIYGAKGSSFPWNYDWGYITEKPQKIYLNIFNWPKNNSIEVNGIVSKVNNVNLLDTNQELKFVQNGRFLSIDITDIDKKDLAKVLVVNYKDENLKIDNLISQSLNKSIRLDRISGTYNIDSLTTTWNFKVNTPGKYKIQLLSNEKKRHSNPQWVGSKQEGTIVVNNKFISVKLNKDSEKINPSLFFYKQITSNVGEIEFTEKGNYTLHLKGFEIGAGKWTNGLGLSHIQLLPSKSK